MASKERKDRVVRLRLSEAEHSQLASVCAEMGIGVSEALRRGARIAAGLGPSFDGEARSEIQDLVRQIRGVATNINQMTKAMNSGRVPANAALATGFGQLTELLGQAQDAYLSLCAKAQVRGLSASSSEVSDGRA